MENYLHRAMEVYRLSNDQLRDLQAIEADRGYLMTISIQQRYRLPTLKEVYGIPDKESDIKLHSARLTADLISEKVVPYRDFHTGDVQTAHEYDWKIKNCLTDFNFKKPGKSAKDSVKESDREELFDKTAETDVIHYSPRSDLD